MLILWTGLLLEWPVWANASVSMSGEGDPVPTPLSATSATQDPVSLTRVDLGLDGQVVEDSPVLRRWLQNPPNLLDEIRNTPVVPTRLQANFESSSHWRIGLQDLRLADRLTLSGDYRQSSQDPDMRQYGSEIRYFLAPMGSLFNLAPQLGYRALEQENRSLSGVSYGAFAVLALAPGAADLTGSYSWVAPREPQEGQATLAEVTAAYAISPSFRLSARYSLRNSTLTRESSLGFGVEWIP
ncbi:hypothetical protein JX360_02505 [Synechococcus bigranulatus str. 'Rupite']|uniref:Uncharacterized protein n=1 Tax=Thermostichus vulcanus str. 'Rupite' TaxID=2813851 RepID=A0ABT0C7M2_THEVL|nr:hypothetical protein [Thermostichus vulcanus str. 'Rupite']